MFALKLLAAIATHTNMMPKDKQLSAQLLSFYSQSSPLLNRHTLTLVLHLVPSLPIPQLLPLVPHTSQILHSMLSLEQTESLSAVLDIHFLLLEKLTAGFRAKALSVDDVKEALGTFEDLVALFRLNDCFDIIEKAATSLILILQLYALAKPQQKIFFTEQTFSLLVMALQSTDSDPGRVLGLQKKLLKCVYWALIQGEDEYRLDIGRIDRTVVLQVEKSIQSIVTKLSEGVLSQQDGLKKVCLEVHRLLQQKLREYQQDG